MTALTFDTHKLVKLLKKSGFTDEQSEGVTNALSEVIKIDTTLASKHDLDLQTKEIELKIADSKTEILKYMVGLLLGQAALVAALVKLL